MLVKKFLTGEKDLSEEGLFGKKQYQGLDKVYEFGQKNYSKYLANKTKSKTKTKDMNYDSKSNFNKYRIVKKLIASLLIENLIIWSNFMINWNNLKK